MHAHDWRLKIVLGDTEFKVEPWAYCKICAAQLQPHEIQERLRDHELQRMKQRGMDEADGTTLRDNLDNMLEGRRRLHLDVRQIDTDIANMYKALEEADEAPDA